MDDKYKLAIIDEENVLYYGKATANSWHSQYLYEYISEHYKDDPIFPKLSDKVSPDQLACYLVYAKNKAVFMNETKFDAYGKPKYGSFACFVLPENISEQLLEQLLNIRGLDNFNQIVIERVHLSEDNILEDNPVFDYEELPIRERLQKLAKSNQKTR